MSCVALPLEDVMMVSPFVRRRRLAMEILRLRDEYEYSADRLASAVGVKRQTISRIENGHVRPDPDRLCGSSRYSTSGRSGGRRS